MVELKCSNCGADITLDDSREFGFCQYCGTKILITSGTKPIEAPTTASLLKRADDFLSQEYYGKAEEYYNRVLDIDPDNARAQTGLKQVNEYYIPVLYKCSCGEIERRRINGKYACIKCGNQLKEEQAIRALNIAHENNKEIEDFKINVIETIDRARKTAGNNRVCGFYCNNDGITEIIEPCTEEGRPVIDPYKHITENNYYREKMCEYLKEKGYKNPQICRKNNYTYITTKKGLFGTKTIVNTCEIFEHWVLWISVEW